MCKNQTLNQNQYHQQVEYLINVHLIHIFIVAKNCL